MGLQTLVGRAGLEPAQPFLVKGFSYYSCFYTSQLRELL